uniref:Uncharacterized protein n=1 Tax=Arundo donax TaxID=35708 RepID=A0A0A8XPG8_ARUDO
MAMARWARRETGLGILWIFFPPRSCEREGSTAR